MNYLLRAKNGSSFLEPREVATRFASEFPQVDASENAAAQMGSQYIEKFKALIDAGLGNKATPSLDAIKAKWEGALAITVLLDDQGNGSFQTISKNDPQLEFIFATEVAARQHRSIARRAANSLGYELESLEGD